MANNTIYVGDIIQIVTPEIVTRVGYEFSYDDACKEVKETHKEDIYELLRKVKVRRWDKVEKEIIKSLAYDLIAKKMHSGNKRMIFTKRDDKLADVKVKVTNKQMARTGTYFPPTGGGTDYWGEYDYEPGGLTDMKTHVLFKFHIPGVYGKDALIELCNIKRCDAIDN